MRTTTKPNAAENHALERLTHALAETDQASVIRQILAELLSPAELQGISRRWLLLEMLQAGKSQREIAAQLHLSLATVSRGSRELKQADSALKRLMAPASTDTELP